jgi:HD-GYP domain-containing protein (c-di-GMP phosphodiesterase class II)
LKKSTKVTLCVDDLKVGMHVVGLDRSWLTTSLLSHRFMIKTEKDIEKLKQNGIRHVIVEVDKTDSETASEASKNRQTPENPDTFSNFSAIEIGEISVRSVNEVKVLQDRTVTALKASFEQVRLGKAIPTRELRGQVEETIGILLSNPHAISLLAVIHENDDETYVHSANTMLLATGYAIRQKIPRDQWISWGIAALLHDMGKTQVPSEILKKTGRLDAREWEIMRTHPLLGYRILRKNPEPDVRNLAAKVAVEHHERENGTGYPYGLGLDKIHPVSRALMVLDIYEALTADRVYRAGLAPQKAIQYLLEGGRDKVDPSIARELSLMVGIYPLGTFIEVEGGDIGIILDYSDRANHQGEAKVLVMLSPERKPLRIPRVVTLPEMASGTIWKTYHHRDLGLSLEQVEVLIKKIFKST